MILLEITNKNDDNINGGLNLKLSQILYGNNFDVHGHEITFEKTGDFEYSSVYSINCNRKFVINLSSVVVTVKEIIVPDDDVVYSDIPGIADLDGYLNEKLCYYQGRCIIMKKIDMLLNYKIKNCVELWT